MDIIMAMSWTGTWILFKGRSSLSRPSVSWFGVVVRVIMEEPITRKTSRIAIVPARTSPSFVTLRNPSFHTTSPGVSIILKNMVIRSSIKMVFSPLKINFTGTFDIRIIPARNTPATAYPKNVWNKNTDTIKAMVPTSLVLGSSLWIMESAG